MEKIKKAVRKAFLLKAVVYAVVLHGIMLARPALDAFVMIGSIGLIGLLIATIVADGKYGENFDFHQKKFKYYVTICLGAIVIYILT